MPVTEHYAAADPRKVSSQCGAFEVHVELAIAVAAKTAAYLFDIGKFAGMGKLIGAFNDGRRWLAGIKVKSSKETRAPRHWSTL